MLVRFVGSRAFLVESGKYIRDVSGKTPGLLEVGAPITPRRLKTVLASIEIREEEIHSLHEPLDLMQLPVGAIPWPFDD